MPGDDKIKTLYDAMAGKVELGTLEEFTQKLQDPAKRKTFYDAVNPEYDLGDYTTFEGKVLKKKEPTLQPSVSSLAKPITNAPSVVAGGTSGLENTQSEFSTEPIDYLGTGKNQPPPVTTTTKTPVSITAGQTIPTGNVMNAAGANNITNVGLSEKSAEEKEIESLTEEYNKWGSGEGDKYDPNHVQKGVEDLSDITGSFLRGSSRLGSMLAKTPAFLYDIAAYPQNKIAELTGLDIAVSSDQVAQQYGLPENEIAKYYDNAVAQSQAKLAEKYDKGISEYFAAGDYEKGFGLLANSVAESAPISISMALGNAAGLTTAQSILGGGAVFAAQKKDELDKENPNMDEVAKMDNALATGLFEGIFEQFGVTKLGGATKNILLKEGLDVGKKAVEEGFKKTYWPILKKYLGTSAEESLSEMATQYAQNAVDKFSNAKPDLDLMDGVIDAGIIGLGAGTSMSAIPTALEVAKTKKSVQRAGEIQEERKSLETDLSSETVKPENKAAIVEKLHNLNSEEADIAFNEKAAYNNLSEESKKQVDDLLVKQRKVIDSITDPGISEPTRDVFRKDLDNIDEQIIGIYDQAAEHVKEKKAAEEKAKEKTKEGDTKKETVLTPEQQNAEELEYLESIKEFGLNEEEQKRYNQLAKTTESKETAPPVAKEKVTPTPSAETQQQQEDLYTTDTAGKVEPVELSTTQETITNGQNENQNQKADETKTEVLTTPEVTPTETAVEETAAVPKKEKVTQELIDEEETLDAERKDDEGSVKRLNDDIAAMKQYKDVDIAEKKFKAVLERAFKMKDEKKITRTTYTKYKKMAQQIIGGKGNVDAEEAKYKVTQLAEQVKNKLLGEGYKKVILSTGLPVTPQNVADLVDLTANLINRGIDAGFATKEAVEKALTAIKKHPTYKKLSSGIDEKQFDKMVTDKFSPKTEEKKVDSTKISKKQGEINTSGTKKRKTTKRIVESDFVDPGIKEGLSDEGYDYVPRGINMAQEDARKIVKHFDEGGKIDKLIETVTGPDMDRVEKNSMAVTIFEHLNKQIGKETDEDAKSDLRKKAIKLHQFVAKNLTESAQDLRINGMLNKSIAEGDPDVAITLLKEQAQEKINKDFSDKKVDKKINDAVNSINDIEKEVSKRVEETLGKEVEKEIEKRLLKVIPKETTDKITSFFDSMMIKTNGKFFADPTGVGAITTTLFNGSVQVIRDSIRLGIAAYNGIANSVMINNAVQAGIDYIKEHHKEPFDEVAYRKEMTDNVTTGLKEAGITITQKRERKKEIIDTVNEALDEIKTGKTSEPKVTTVNKDQVKHDIAKAKELMSKSFEGLEMSEYAKKKLTADVIEHLENNNGKISKNQFKNLYAEALGYDFVSPEAEADIKANFEEIQKATDLRDKLNSLLDEAVAKEKGQNMSKEEAADYKKRINDLNKELFDQTLIAEKANDKVSDYFRGDKNFYQTIASMIQGNLLTPMSQIFNISGYVFTLPVRFMTGLGGTALDYLEAGLARTKLGSKYLDENIKTNTFTEVSQGLKMGLVPGLKESVYKLKTGQLSEDFMMRDVQQKFNAFEALQDFWKGKFKNKDFETKLTAFIEGHFGIPAEIMFRMLGPADITVRKSAEYGRLAEMAKAKGLQDFEFMRAVLNPEEETKEEAKKYSTKVTYQNDNVVSDLLNSKKGGEFIEKIAGEKLAYHINGTLKILKTGVIPFTKTPLNIMSELIMYMMPPLAITRAMIAAKQGDRRTFNLNMSKAMVGAGLAYVTYQLIANGLMTAGQDDEDTEKEKKAMYENIGYKKLNWSALKRFMDGEKNWNQIQNSDTWINYEKMGLPGMVMSTWAGYYKDKTSEEVKDRNFLNDALGGSTAALKASIEQSFLKGTSDALTAIMNPGTKKANYFMVGYLGALGSAIYPNTLASISKSSDPFIRDKRTDEGFTKMLVNEYKTKLFMGDKLPTKVTLWGEDAKAVPEGTNPYVYYLLDPIKSKDIDSSKFGYKIFDFWNSIPETDKDLKNKILPSVPKDQIEVKHQDVALTIEEYNLFQKMVGKNRAMEAEKYVVSGDFDTDTPEQRVKKLQKIYSNGYKSAKREFIRESDRMQKLKTAK